MKVEICEHCGAKVVEYKHGLSRQLARVLYLIARESPAGYPVAMSEVGLTYSQRCNSQKLRYWDLIKKVGDPRGKGGDWLVTDLGWQFLRAEIALPHFVWTYRGSRVRYEGRLIPITQLSGTGWKWRPEYAQESLPHI